MTWNATTIANIAVDMKRMMGGAHFAVRMGGGMSLAQRIVISARIILSVRHSKTEGGIDKMKYPRALLLSDDSDHRIMLSGLARECPKCRIIDHYDVVGRKPIEE